MENLTVTTSNNLIFKRVENNKKVNCEIKISLNDECKNGHQDFHITATFWEIGKPRNDKYFYAAGSCHDEILKHFPEYKIFVDLHGCDYLGVPSHCVANGFYFLTDGFSKTKPNDKNFKKEYCDYYRINANQFDALNVAKDQNYYGFLLLKLGVLDQWKKEADKAIKTLEEFTNTKFIVDSVKNQFGMTAEELETVKNRITDGFYTSEAIEKRQSDKIEAEKNSFIAEAKNKRDEAIKNAHIEYKVQLLVLNSGISLKNTIYYTHSDTLSFNWKSYEPKISEEQFKDFCSKLNLEEYQGLTVNMADLKIEYSPIKKSMLPNNRKRFCFVSRLFPFNWQIQDILTSNTDEILIIETAF